MARFETYAQAEAFLLSFVNYEAAGKWPVYNTTNFDLERFAGLLERLGAPHRRPGLIHVAGTKGKGSVCALLGAILQAAGIKTGVYTSPHLVSFRERIRINGEEISPKCFAQLAGTISEQFGATPPASPGDNNFRTTFEILTAMGLKHFADEDCQAAVIETGLGGRLDATNVVAPELTIITALGLDHQHILGPTLADIAREKGGIIKPGAPCVLAEQTETAEREATPVILAIARERAAPVIRPCEVVHAEAVGMKPHGSLIKACRPRVSEKEARAPDLGQIHLALPGEHQIRNFQTALAAVEMLLAKGWYIPDYAIYAGAAKVRMAGRFEVAGSEPLFILDAAHCPLSMRATVAAVNRFWPERDAIVLVSALSDKNVRETLAELRALNPPSGLTHSGAPGGPPWLIVFAAPSPRACRADVIAAFAKELGLPCETAASPRDAMRTALRLAKKDSSADRALILATGSFYSVEPLRQAYNELLGAERVKDPKDVRDPRDRRDNQDVEDAG
ncbi:MAG: bifunctional folylpolyglutamate synthase/dihydrofolate synthase [Candidatus Sumerlaeota bacterium]|nr:bifunctional folylpolyglutamate synthase/dihydrofolate synthase [Candidatus Sumerlaeota bacterium]